MSKSNITDTASIAPTFFGRAIPVPDINGIIRKSKSVMDVVDKTVEPMPTTIRQPSYAQLLVSSTDRFVTQNQNLIPVSNNALSNPVGYINPAVTGEVILTMNTNITRAWVVDELVQVLNATLATQNFQGKIQSITGFYNNILTIRNITNINGTFPSGAAATYNVYNLFPPESPAQIRLTGTLIPYLGLDIAPTPPITANSFVLQYPQYLLQGHFTRLAVTQLSFQWNIPTIVKGVNDNLSISFLDTDTSVVTAVSATIAPGWYTPTQLATIIQATVRLNGVATTAGFTVTYITGVFIFNCTNGIYKMELYGDASIPNSPTTLFLLTIGMNYDSFFVLDNSGVYVPNVAQQIISGPPQMTYTRWIDITSTGLTRYAAVKDATTSLRNSHLTTLARVYSTPASNTASSNSPAGPLSGLPFTLTTEFNSPKYIKWNGIDALQNFDLNCFDEYGQRMYWEPNFASEFQFTLLASET